jgi:hypothetical protein
MTGLKLIRYLNNHPELIQQTDTLVQKGNEDRLLMIFSTSISNVFIHLTDSLLTLYIIRGEYHYWWFFLFCHGV